MKYKILQDRNDLRLFAVNETTGKKYCFTPVEELPEHLTDDMTIMINDLGDMYIAETVDGSPIDQDELDDIWDAINRYWDRNDKPN